MSEIKIDRQGSAVVDHAVVIHQSDEVALIDISMSTKRVQVGGLMIVDGVPGVTIETHEGSVHLHPNATGGTDITIPEFDGWDIHSAMGGKWTVQIALFRRSASKNKEKA